MSKRLRRKLSSKFMLKLFTEENFNDNLIGKYIFSFSNWWGKDFEHSLKKITVEPHVIFKIKEIQGDYVLIEAVWDYKHDSSDPPSRSSWIKQTTKTIMCNLSKKPDKKQLIKRIDYKGRWVLGTDKEFKTLLEQLGPARRKK